MRQVRVYVGCGRKQNKRSVRLGLGVRAGRGVGGGLGELLARHVEDAAARAVGEEVSDDGGDSESIVRRDT